jgi:hypothetical protein
MIFSRNGSAPLATRHPILSVRRIDRLSEVAERIADHIIGIRQAQTAQD